MLRWGILGTGADVEERIAPAVRRCGHDLAVVGSRSLNDAQAVAARQGARRARGAYEDVIAADDVDAVYVGLPNALHEQWAIAALEAGKHVVCAAPLATDAGAAGRVAATSARVSRVLLEALPVRFHPRTRALLDLLAEGTIGDVRLLHLAHLTSVGVHESARTNVVLGGGALLGAGPGVVSLARSVTGRDPETVTAVQARASGVDRMTAALLGFPGGVAATVQVSLDAAEREVADVVGTRGSAHLPHAFTADAGVDAPLVRDGAEVASWREDPYEHMVRAFTAAVHGDEVVDCDDAVATLSVLDRIRTSAG